MNKLKEYLRNVNEISHVTFDPYGPGVVRIHLVPPKKVKPGVAWVVILNGESILPICMGWAVLLREFINAINEYEGKSVSEDDIKAASNKAVDVVSKLFPKTSKGMLTADLKEIIEVILCVARMEEVNEEIGYLSIKKYAKYMPAPHRMDLLVSAMEKDNAWNCNQRCINCYAANQTKSNEKELSTDEWKKIIDKLKEARIAQLTFTGGEPTLRDDLPELIKYSSWFVTRLNTNGQLLSADLCEKLVDASLDAVQVTFYSHKKDIHNIMVGVDGYDRTIEGIKNAIEAGLLVSINTPLGELNSDYTNTIKYLHEEFGIRYFTCSGLILTGNATKNASIKNRLSGSELKLILRDALEYCREKDLELKFTSPGWIDEEFLKNNKLNPPICGASISNMAVSPSGDLIPCQSYLDGTTFGNLLNKDFKTIWNSSEIKKFRNKIVKLDYNCPLNIKELEYEKNN